jgi:glycosyltransferase involved in cell wall biosynthesis
MTAFSRLHSKHPRVRLVVLGHFEDKLDPISVEARKILNEHPAIIHIDWNENVEYFMQLCQLMVHASYREGFPNTLLQAGAMNCPIVCSRIEGNVDVVSDKQTGILFEAGNAEDLYEKLDYAISHKDEMQRYAANLLKRINENFGQPYVHSCLKEKYEEILIEK